MRRKSKRNESADKNEHSSPEKSSRRSGRHSRRRKKSSSPEQLKVDKIIPPEHASSEEHTNDETEKNIGVKPVEGSRSPETERVATPEDKGGSEASSSSSKSRRLKVLKQTPSDSQEDIKSSVSQKKSYDDSVESTQPKDDAFSENKPKEEGGVVWKVQSANGSGGEIQKLKICRQRLNSSSNSSSTTPRRRLSRTFKGPQASSLGENEKSEHVQETKSTHCSSSNAPDQVETQEPLVALGLCDDLPKEQEQQDVEDKQNLDQQETEIVTNEESDDRNAVDLREKGKMEGSISPEELQIHPIEEINSPPEPKESNSTKQSAGIDPSSQRRDQKCMSRSNSSAGENSSSEGEDAKRLLEAGNVEEEKPSPSSPLMVESTEVGQDHDSIVAAVEIPPTIIETDHVVVTNESHVDLLPVVGKRRWGASKSIRPSKKPVLSISTDSLKKLIPEVKPVPAEEVQMNVDEEEEVEDGEMKDDDENDDIIVDKNNEIIMTKETDEKQVESEKEEIKIEHEKKKEVRKEKEKEKEREKEERRKAMPNQKISNSQGNKVQEHQKMTRKISIVSEDARKLARSPSPAHHRPSSVLFITNLVRPFTVPQLRELLARTGTIASNGFWIDRIKSKCYVQYTDPEAAIETRHALHGVRWPVSNPKTLCVEFAAHDEMIRAQSVTEEPAAMASRKPELMDVKVERTVEGWVAEQARIRREDKPTRRVTAQIREWDVGKPAYMDDLFQERTIQEREYEERLKEREKEKKMRLEKRHHSPDSLELHAHKAKRKDEDAPAKLLDDLFRKTKSSPCIYWLPLTAEQIVVKEEMRRQHMAEHERRVAEMKKTDQARREREKRERRK